MSIQISINNITGYEPYNIYVCNNPATTCIYINTINDSDIPYSFDIPVIMESNSDFILKVVDNTECISTQILTP